MQTLSAPALGPMLETERLILRPPIQADLDGWAELGADAEAMRFIGGAGGRAQAWRSMATIAGSWALQGFAMFSVIEKASGRWVGRIGPWQPEGWPGTEVGWGLLTAAQGRGYALEGATAGIDLAFEHLGWSEVIHSVDPANSASRRLAERLGSRLRGPGRLPVPFDAGLVEIWGQSREEWYVRRRSSDGSRQVRSEG